MNDFSLPPLGLRWLLSQRSLRLLPINHTEQQFSTIQNSELADPSGFIQSPSVMLTLGLSLTNQSGQFRDYAQRMAKAGVVAIGFGTGMKHDEVPVELIQATAELGLGLFEIPKEISFISITTTAQAEQVRQLNAQKEALDKEMSALSREAQEHGLEALVEYCASLCGGVVSVVDSDGRVNSESDPYSWNPTARALAALNNLTVGHRARVDHHNGKFWLIQRIWGVGERFHIFVLGVREPPDSRIRSLVQHCATVAAILLRRPEELHHARAELASLAMALHLGKDTGSTGAMGWLFEDLADSQGRIRPVVFMCLDTVMVERAVNMVSRTLQKQGRIPALLRLDSTTVLLFVRGERTVAEIRNLFGPLSNKIRIAVGLPTPVEELSSRQVDMLQVQVRRARMGHVVDPHNQAPLWLENPVFTEALEERAQEIYGRLYVHDAEHGTQLASTLDAWAENGGVLQAVAAELGVHRQTVRARLNTIEAICELDLGSPLTLAELVLISVVGLGHS